MKDEGDRNWKIRGTNAYLVEDLLTGFNEGFIRVGIKKREEDKKAAEEKKVRNYHV